eukprot:3719234-Rhodomonas_salina.1
MISPIRISRCLSTRGIRASTDPDACTADAVGWPHCRATMTDPTRIDTESCRRHVVRPTRVSTGPGYVWRDV